MIPVPLKRASIVLAATCVLGVTTPSVMAENYKIDPAHSFIQFKILHLGFSVLVGRFNELEGSFSYDEANPSASEIEVTVATKSVDTNHAKRDKHIRNEDFLDVERFATATFKSTGFSETKVEGELTLHGVTRPISLEVEQIGAGDDPWGGYRRGFKAHTKIKRSDFGMGYDLGPKSNEMELHVFIEGIRES